MKQAFLASSALACTLLFAADGHAQDQDPLLECFGIEEDADRLACFDRVAARRANSTAQTEADTATDTDMPSDEEEIERSRFGLPRLSLPGVSFSGLFGDRDGNNSDDIAQNVANLPDTEILERSDDGTIRKVRMRIEDIVTFGFDVRFELTNGQVWEVNDGNSVRVPDDEVLYAEIRTSSFGGHFLRINGQGRSIRVKRIE